MTKQQSHKQVSEMAKEQQCEEQLQEKEKIMTEYINTLKRVQADFENYIKRTEKEKPLIERQAQQKIFLEMLKIVDVFEAALNTLKKQQGNQETVKGIHMVYNQLMQFLQHHNIKPIETQELDPFKHEVLKKVESDQEENSIIEVIQKGYIFHEFILRPSKVIISNGKKEVKNHNSEVIQNG